MTTEPTIGAGTFQRYTVTLVRFATNDSDLMKRFLDWTTAEKIFSLRGFGGSISPTSYDMPFNAETAARIAAWLSANGIKDLNAEVNALSAACTARAEMVGDAVYTLAARREIGPVGVKVLVAHPNKLSEKEGDLCQDAAYNLCEALVVEMRRLDPQLIAHKQAEGQALRALFGGNAIYVEEIPNGYDSKWPIPWLVVTTTIGHFTIGWRKRVIEIDWSRTTNTKTAGELFQDEDVTKGDYKNPRFVHAWGYDKAKEYIERIMS